MSEKMTLEENSTEKENKKTEPSEEEEEEEVTEEEEEVSEEEEEEDDDDDDDSEEEDDDDDSEESSFELSDVEIQKDDTPGVKNLKIKLLKEKSKLLDAKETIGSLVDQITAYKVSVEEEKLILETQLKQEKKTKLELFEIYKEMEGSRDNISKQLEIVILECEQLDKEKQALSKENINNLQTLMNEITHIEETNSHLEKELEKERELHRQTQANHQTQIQLVQKLESYNKELSSSIGSPVIGGSASTDQQVIILKKQLADTQAALTKEKEKLLNIDNLLFQARRVLGVAESNGGQLDQNSLFEITQLKNVLTEEKQLHHKTVLALEEEKKKSELNKKTADNVVARMKELISSHHETLRLLDEERENSKDLLQEIQTLKEQAEGSASVASNSTATTQPTTQPQPIPIIVGGGESTTSLSSATAFEEGKLKADPSMESISSHDSNTAGNDMLGNALLTAKYGAKMYKTLRMKKNAAGVKQPTLGGEFMFPDKPTSPETNNNNNTTKTSPESTDSQPVSIRDVTSYSSTNSILDQNFFLQDTASNSSSKKEMSVQSTTKSNLKMGGSVKFDDATSPIKSGSQTVGGAISNGDGKLMSYGTISGSTSSGSLVGESPSKSKSSKLDKERKEREKKIEKEKKEILKKIEKDLKKKEKESKKDKDSKKSSSTASAPPSQQSSTSTPNTAQTPNGTTSNPDTPREPSPVTSKSNSVSSLRDSFENNPNTTGGGSANSSEAGSLSNKSDILSGIVNSSDKSPSLSSKDSKDTIKEKRKSRFFS